MLNLKRCSMEEFPSKIAGKFLVCFGCGNAFNEMIRNYYDLKLEEKIKYIIDNDIFKQGRHIFINGRYLEIKSPEYLFENIGSNTVLLFALYKECALVIKQLDDILKLDGCETYVFSIMDAISQTDFIVPDDLYSEKEQIPKVLHFFWFGKGSYSELNEKCLASWRKYCPDFKIMRWDESNYDVTKHPYMHAAYKAKKWGFVPDYARLDVIYNYGGIYLDTDVEVLKALHLLLRQKAFCGRQRDRRVNMGLGFGAVKGNQIIRQWMKHYDEIDFQKDGNLNLTTSPTYQTQVLTMQGYDLRKNGFQKIGEMMVYPAVYFDPIYKRHLYDCISEKSFTCHHYEGTWNEKKGKINCELIENCLKRLKGN